MIDFWELSGRLLLMDPGTRNREIYDANTGILPIQSDGCILLGHSNTPTLPFPVQGFYNQLRDYFARKYAGANKLLCPAISMFALGETGVMFFNQLSRELFEDLSSYLRTASGINNRSDTGSDSMFYIVLAVLMLDTTTRASVAKGDFLGLDPRVPADRPALQQLANDVNFQKKADLLCFTGDWTKGSGNTLRPQNYPPNGGIPFRHFRFVDGLS